MKTRRPGISALIRCKDEEDFVYLSLLSIKDSVDEIIFIDNASSLRQTMYKKIFLVLI